MSETLSPHHATLSAEDIVQLYSLSGGDLAFVKSQIGIEDDDALKRHIVAVQTKAYKIFPYSCIRRFAFTRLKISNLPAYQHVLKLGKDRKNAILLDIGCCFGNDARKAVADGFPVQNVIASDLRQEFWDLGHELFRSTPDTFPVSFVAGDAFDPAHIAPRAPFYELPETSLPTLSTLTSLTPLQGHVSSVHASSLFHLFGEEKQLQLARALASLLSPLPGSTIFGSHGGRAQKGLRVEATNSRGEHMFCHSPESWEELWDGEIFRKGAVEVKSELVKVNRPDLQSRSQLLSLRWSVTRV